MCTRIIGSDLATTSGSAEFKEQVVHIEAEDDGGEYRALPDPVLYSEALGIVAFPSYISCLILVDRYQKSDYDCRKSSINELLE